MALIKCSECGKEISDTADECVHCGCPLGKVKFYTSNNWTGIASRYIISNNNGQVLAKLKGGEEFEIGIDEDTKFYVWCNTTLSRRKHEVLAYACKLNKFLIEITFMGASTHISEIN